MLRKLGADVVELRSRDDVEVMEDIDSATGLGRKYDALVLPGGESTVQGKLLRELILLAIPSGLSGRLMWNR